jgi:hypothetical protein
MEEQIRALLLADSGVTGMVGARVSWGARGQGAGLPAIVLNVISDVGTYLIDRPSGVSNARVQVDCYAQGYADAKLLSRAVLSVLSGYRGGAIQGVFHAGSRDGREGGTNEAERSSRVSLDFTLTYMN